MAFESAIMHALSAEERRKLATEDEASWMHLLADMEKEATSYCILEKVGEIQKMMLQEVPLSPANDESIENNCNNNDNNVATDTLYQGPEERARPKAPLGRAPWYPVTHNKPIVVPEVPYEPASDQTPGAQPEKLANQDFRIHLRILRSEMGPESKYRRRVAPSGLLEGAYQIVRTAQAAAMDMLRSTAREGTTWASKLNAFDTLLEMCSALAGRKSLFDPLNTTMIAAYVCDQFGLIDQMLMRFVQRMDMAERARLAREKDLINRLEDVMRDTRRDRKMAELETVRDWLLSAL